MNVEVSDVLEYLFYKIFDDKIDIVVLQVHNDPF